MTPTTKMKTPAEIAELYAAAAIAAQNAGVANRGFSEALARAFETHAEKDVAEVDRRQAEKDEKHRARDEKRHCARVPCYTPGTVPIISQ